LEQRNCARGKENHTLFPRRRTLCMPLLFAREARGSFPKEGREGRGRGVMLG